MCRGCSPPGTCGQSRSREWPPPSERARWPSRSCTAIWRTMTNVDIDELRKLFLFERLTDEQLTKLASSGEIKEFEQDEEIVRQGEPAECFAVLVEGELQMVSETVAGRDRGHAARLHAGGVRRAPLRLPRRPGTQTYQHTLRATAPSRVFVLPRPQVRLHRDRVVPDGHAPARRPAVRRADAAGDHRPAAAADRARHDHRGAHPRAEQPGRGGRARGERAALADQVLAGGAREARRGRHPAAAAARAGGDAGGVHGGGRQAAPPLPDGDLRRRGRAR